MRGRVAKIVPIILFICGALAVQVIILLLADNWLEGLVIADWVTALAAVVIIDIVNALLWPLIIRFLQRFSFAAYLLLSLLLNGLSVAVAAALLPGLQVDGLWTAALVVASLAVGTTLVSAPFAFSTADYYTQWLVRRATRGTGEVVHTDVPGIIFLQIDGASHAVIRHAIAEGRLPTLAQWIDRGSHRLVGWEADLPCQTSASQAGILLGSNADIPAFRWLDKSTGRVFVSNHPRDARDIEARLSTGKGLLADGGVARGNIFSGDASDTILTFATALNHSGAPSAAYAAFLSSPVNLWRTLTLCIWDMGLELYARLRAHMQHVEPHGHRSFPYPLVRSATTVFLRDVVVYALIGDMFRGVPAAYADFVGYDEVAHHSGIFAPDAMATLQRIDHQIARLERVSARAPRPYHFVLLSDHGQTQGATFKQRYGMSLADYVRQLMAGQTVESIADESDTWDHVNAFLTEANQSDDETLQRIAHTAAGSHVHEGVVELGTGHPEVSTANVTVLASGNLGLIYFQQEPGQVSYEAIMAGYPDLLPGLVSHPGVGFVVVRSTRDGPLVLGASGVYRLASGLVQGSDPLAEFGANARRHLLRVTSFSNAPDILVNSFYDPDRDEAAAFEELIGGHGGLGGKQMHPFLLYPRTLPEPDSQILGAERLHTVLRGWRTYLQDGTANGHDPATEQTGVTIEPSVSSNAPRVA